MPAARPAGQNSVSRDLLRGFVERVERIRAEKQELADDEAAVMAEAKANGFDTKILRAVVKRRAAKPHDVQEAEALFDMYLHALGMATEPPLFRFAGLAGIDVTAREQVIARMSDFVPAAGLGDIVVNMGGRPVRLVRDKDGAVQVHEVAESTLRPEAPAKPAGRRGRTDAPDVDAAGAEALGAEYARDNRPVIDNPFPFGDPRRARFDAGWRRETGSDGMGPDEDD